MKKGILYFLVFLFPMTVFSQIQSGKLVYKIEFIQEEFEKRLKEFQNEFPSSSKEAVEYMFKPFQNTKLATEFVELKLTFNKQEAIFGETTSYLETDDGMDADFLLTMLLANAVYYHNLEKSQYKKQFYTLEKEWLIEDELIPLDWELIPDSKIIQGYTCYKATVEVFKINSKTEKEVVEVWYAPSLPFSFGPNDYYGLPGLILELKRGYYKFYTHKLSFSDKSKKIKAPTKGEKHNRDSYETKMNEILEKRRRKR